jgi:hypothetical protein
MQELSSDWWSTPARGSVRSGKFECEPLDKSLSTVEKDRWRMGG